MCHVVYVEQISSGVRGEFLPVTYIFTRAVTHLRWDTAPQELKIDEIIDFEILVDLNSKIYYESYKTGIIHI